MIVGLNVVREKELGTSGVLKSWVYGQLFCFAVLQVMAVPMILMRWQFNVLFWSYMSIVVVLFGFGAWRLVNGRTRIRIRMPELKPLELLLLMIVILLILWQAGNYFFGMHLDEDDARWLAEANDALEYGDMMIRDFDTGAYLGHVGVPKDATSPWPMMIAFFSRLLHTKTSVFAHTIYAPIELLLMYAVYWLMASELFETRDAKLTFILSVAVINLFFGKTVFTQSTFSLVRIWQGKGTVAAVIVPLLFYLFIRIQKRDESEDWRLVPVTCCAACLMSGMGISLSAIAAGLLGACHIVINRKWRRIPMLALSVLPSGIFLLIYTMFRSLY